VLAPLFVFVLMQRLPKPAAPARERRSVWWTNLMLLGMAAAMAAVFGVVPYLVLQLTVLLVAGAGGIWLFYMQHQFEDAYWERGGDWSYEAAALKGSSFYKLPAILQWFSGNIGFHHIHHLSPKIPNYKLPRAYKENTIFHIPPMTILASLSSLRMRLYDEERKIMVGWNALKRYQRKQVSA
jgi:omega-6 fatty acid desaturase (delta-12 desaturase)